ncbi:hypothetical protein P7K49_033463 [Saguinus oedipus]|uniref:Uncharacterized protein n=1 Tax=Saguinus oedipus TaxID=9490 RepID=A0ABQ9TS08_SAGOE|nr:hypothetical protein P7K49_033463 [Saguinus oedipus]
MTGSSLITHEPSSLLPNGILEQQGFLCTCRVSAHTRRLEVALALNCKEIPLGSSEYPQKDPFSSVTTRILTHRVFLQAMVHGVLDLPTPRRLPSGFWWELTLYEDSAQGLAQPTS